MNADVGTYDSWYWNHPPMYHEKGMYLPYNEILKTVVDVPVITAGRMENPDLASEAYKEGPDGYDRSWEAAPCRPGYSEQDHAWRI